MILVKPAVVAIFDLNVSVGDTENLGAMNALLSFGVNPAEAASVFFNGFLHGVLYYGFGFCQQIG